MPSDSEPSLPAEPKPDLPREEQSVSISPGTGQLDLRLELPTGVRLKVHIETRTPDGLVLEQRELAFGNPPGEAAGLPVPPPRGWLHARLDQIRALLRPAQAERTAWPEVLFLLAGALYLLTRLIALADFPIYFFTDEAIQTVLAADLARDHFLGMGKEFLPTFFVNGNQYNLSVSVYAQVLPYLLFGKSVWITRGVAALFTLLAAYSVGRILKDIFHTNYGWLGVLVLSTTPAWFLHSRTAFETAMAVSFYAAFLYFYLKYRCENPRFLYAAVTMGALAFYTYSPAQMYMLVTAVLLLVLDARYHWQQRATVLRGFGLAVLLGLPYARFLYNHPNENAKHLQILSSYWVQDITLTEKLSIFGREYLSGLDPTYWYVPNNDDLPRHLMKNYGHLLRWTLPFGLAGLVWLVKGLRQAPNRVILAAMLAAPSGAAIAHLGITRALVMVIPAAVITTLGLVWLLDWVQRRGKLPQIALALPVFLFFGGLNLYMLSDALARGPTWYSDYGLGGMQYGARQVMTAIAQEASAHPGEKILLSPSFANGTTEVARFFFDDPAPFDLGSVDGYINEKHELDSDTLFIMLPDEFQAVTDSGKFSQIRLENYLPYPDGRPGFIFARLTYAPDVDRILAAEKEGRKALRQATVVWNGQLTDVGYSVLDMGQIQDGFDGDDQTILRSMEANPLQFDIRPKQPVVFQNLGVRVGGTATRVTAYIYEEGQSRPKIFSREVIESPEPRDVVFNFAQPLQSAHIWVKVLSVNDEEPAHVHVWEVKVW